MTMSPAVRVLVLAWCLIVTPARAGLYWGAGVRAKTISVCFVGDAATSRPLRVQEVLTFIKRYEHAANVKFSAFPLTCGAPTKAPDGTDRHDGDIRVVLPNTSAPFEGPVPGMGCRMFLDANGNYNHGNEGGGSWSNSPVDLEPNRPCLYNLKLNDDGAAGMPYLNHTLHEFGHALGLAHEHERDDVDRTLGCTESGFGGTASGGHLTRYDRFSVMHYQFLSCGIEGNYGRSGLSALDQLSVHILYPEEQQVAEYIGTTVVASTAPVQLTSGWMSRGADPSFPATNFGWEIDGQSRSTAPTLNLSLSIGTHSFRWTHSDFLSRAYSYTGQMKVLSPADYRRFVGGLQAAQPPFP